MSTTDPYAGIATEAPTAPAAPANDPYAGIGEAVASSAPAPTLTLTVTNRKGKKIQFLAPADADDAALRKLAAKATGEPRFSKAVVQRLEVSPPAEGEADPATPPIPGAPETLTPAPDDSSALSGFAAGVMKPIDKAAEWLTNTSVGKAIDRFGVDTLGLPSTADATAANEEWRRNNTRTGYQMLGNIAGTAPLARLGGPAWLQGAGAGAVLTDSHDAAGTARDAIFGGVGGQAGKYILGGLGSLAKGVTNQGAKLLNDAGIPLTLGQISQAAGNLPGRVVSGLEDRLAGFPLIGDVVNAARDRGTTGLNLALGNRILSTIGEKLGAGVKAGHEMIDAVQAKLSGRYNQLVPQLRGVADQQFASDLAAAEAIANNAGKKDRLVGVATRLFKNRFNGQDISGQALKDAESELTRLFSKYKNSQGDEGVYGEAIDAVRQALRGLVKRSNPDHAEELQALNTGWAQLKDLRSAVQRGSDRTKATGIVTPGGALRVKASKGYRDPLLEAATDILPNSTPDSGTAGRAALLLGVGAAGGASYVDPREHPILAGALAGTAMLSTRPGQRALGALAFGSRPAAVTSLAVPLNKLSRYAPQLVAPAVIPSDR